MSAVALGLGVMTARFSHSNGFVKSGGTTAAVLRPLFNDLSNHNSTLSFLTKLIWALLNFDLYTHTFDQFELISTNARVKKRGKMHFFFSNKMHFFQNL